MGPSVGVDSRIQVKCERVREGKGEGDDTPGAGTERGGAPADGRGGVANGGAHSPQKKKRRSPQSAP